MLTVETGHALMYLKVQEQIDPEEQLMSAEEIIEFLENRSLLSLMVYPNNTNIRIPKHTVSGKSSIRLSTIFKQKFQ